MEYGGFCGHGGGGEGGGEGGGGGTLSNPPNDGPER